MVVAEGPEACDDEMPCEHLVGRGVGDGTIGLSSAECGFPLKIGVARWQGSGGAAWPPLTGFAFSQGPLRLGVGPRSCSSSGPRLLASLSARGPAHEAPETAKADRREGVTAGSSSHFTPPVRSGRAREAGRTCQSSQFEHQSGQAASKVEAKTTPPRQA